MAHNSITHKKSVAVVPHNELNIKANWWKFSGMNVADYFGNLLLSIQLLWHACRRIFVIEFLRHSCHKTISVFNAGTNRGKSHDTLVVEKWKRSWTFMNNIYECDIKPLGKCFYTHMNTELRVGMLVIGRYIKSSDT